MSLIVSADPGPVSGWLVAMDGESYVDTLSLSSSYRQVKRFFYKHRKAEACYLEKVAARPGFNITAQAALVASMEQVRQAATALKTDAVLVAPQTWQKHFGLIMKTEKRMSAAQRKKVKKQSHWNRLMELMDFDVPPTVEQADAFLIGLYAWDDLEGNRGAVESSGTF